MGVQEIEVGSGDLRFRGIAAGPPDGALVLLLHGFPQTALSWRETVEHLGDRGFHAVALDQRGYSPGAAPQDVDAYRMPLLVEDMIGAAERLGHRRLHVVGHDWGGAVAWAMAGSHPRRVLSMCSVSTPHPRALLDARRHPAQVIRSWYIGAFQAPAVPELLLGRLGGMPLAAACIASGLPRDEALRDLRAITGVGLNGPINWYRAAARAPRELLVPAITVPTLYVWGRHDPFLGRLAAEATERWVSGPYRFVEAGAGHWIPSRNRRALHRLLDDHLARADRQNPRSAGYRTSPAQPAQTP